MKITYDSQVHATYVYLTDKKIARTKQFDKYYIDYDANGDIVGIEYLSEPDIKLDGKKGKFSHE